MQLPNAPRNNIRLGQLKVRIGANTLKNLIANLDPKLGESYIKP